MSGPIVLGQWNFWIVLYLWFVGIGTGAFLTAYYINKKDDASDLLARASWIGVAALAAGSLLLLVDLGRPLRFWHMFVSYRGSSVMWIGSWLITITTILMFIVALTKSKGAAALAAIGAALTASYVGVLLTVSAIQLWSGTLLLPWLFLASAFTTGAAALSLSKDGSRYADVLGEVGKAYGILELIILILFVFWSFAAAPAAALSMVAGKYVGAFWVGVLIIGIAAPLYLEIKSDKKISIAATGLMVIFGGLALRYLVVFAGQ